VKLDVIKICKFMFMALVFLLLSILMKRCKQFGWGRREPCWIRALTLPFELFRLWSGRAGGREGGTITTVVVFVYCIQCEALEFGPLSLKSIPIFLLSFHFGRFCLPTTIHFWISFLPLFFSFQLPLMCF
jgi:hypothetical protein